MANKRITELSPLTSASLDSQDLLVVVDRDFSETKNMSVHELTGYFTDNLIPKESEHSVSCENSETAVVAETSSLSTYATTAGSSTSSSYSANANVSVVGGKDGMGFAVYQYTQNQVNNLTNVQAGTVIYNLTSGSFQGYVGSQWRTFTLT